MQIIPEGRRGYPDSRTIVASMRDVLKVFAVNVLAVKVPCTMAFPVVVRVEFVPEPVATHVAIYLFFL
jgi:hypothetical protein